MIISLIFMLIINSIVGTVVIATTLTMTSTPAVPIVLGWVVTLISLLLYYGFSVILGNFYQGKPTRIGDLFIGTKDNVRMSILTLLIFFGILLSFTAVMFAVGFCFFDITTEAGFAQFQDFYINNSLYGLLLIFGLFAIMAIPHVFLFPVMHNNHNLKLREALKQSRKLLKGRFFKFILFCIKAAKIPLTITVVSLAAGFFVTNELLASILSLAFTIGFYYLLIYVILSINAYYYELVGYSENQESEEKSEILQIGENPLLIEENQERESEKGETFDSEANLEKTPTENQPTEEV
jgi:hypothetical protein